MLRYVTNRLLLALPEHSAVRHTASSDAVSRRYAR